MKDIGGKNQFMNFTFKEFYKGHFLKIINSFCLLFLNSLEMKIHGEKNSHYIKMFIANPINIVV